MKNLHHIYKFFIISIALSAQALFAQVKVGDNPTTINASAIFELEASNKGMLMPRLTTMQRDGISNPAVGLLIFNTTTNCFDFYKGPNWFEECGVELPLPAALGSTFTSFSNGSQVFSANTSCQNKLISAGYSAGSCSGTVTTSARTYNLVHINGQCWMFQNAIEAPTAPCAAAINTGCNIWLSTSLGDIGSWGYYNTVTTNGTAGWGTTEPAAGEGLLYQWSAAMNGSTSERAQGVCPTGWHIPSDCEWMYLEHSQGMSIALQNNGLGFRSTTGEGSKLSSLTLSGNNSSGFTALLSGLRSRTDGTFSLRGTYGVWWSSSEVTATTAQRRSLNSSQAGVFRTSFNKATGFSVRCLKD